jgi:hypothetical protein
MKIETFKNMKTLVYQWLEKHPQLRDDDSKLVANIWAECIGRNNLDTLTSRELLQLFVNGKLPQFETIRRTRQKIQEQNAHLRGSAYTERKNRANVLTKNIHSL